MDGGQNIAGRCGVDLIPVPGLSRRAAAGLILFSVLMWGFSPICTRYLVGEHLSGLPPEALSALRYSLAALCFSPMLLNLRGWSRRDLALGAALGVLGVAGFNLPATMGQRTVSAGLTGLLEAAAPMMIVIFSSIRARRLPAGRTLLAGMIGLAGILLLARGSGPVLGDPKGIALILFAALAWSVYCVLVPPLIKRRGALPVTSVIMLAGAVPLIGIGGTQAPHMMQAMTGFEWALLTGLVLGTSVLAMITWNAGTAVLGSVQAGWFMYLVPLVSLIGGAIILGEPVKLVELAGGGLILLSVYLSQR
jgi:drug/metabolite transporter (DMT)-like permease